MAAFDPKQHEPNWWDSTKDWVTSNPTISGAAAGFAVGSVVPGIGNVVGAIGGAVVGHLAGQDAEVAAAKKISWTQNKGHCPSCGKPLGN